MYHSLHDIDFAQYENDSEHLLSANLTTRDYVFVLQNAKNLSRENNSVYSTI